MRIPFVLFVSIFFLSFNLFAESSSGKIILATQHWPPYQVSENGEVNGFSVQVVKCVLDKMEREYEIQVYSWNRAQYLVKSGKADGFFAASQNEKRDQYAVISDTIAAQSWNWYLLKDSTLKPLDPEFKSRARVTAMFGSNMLSWLTKNDYNVIGHTQNTEALIKLLFGKRIDAFLGNRLVVETAMQNNDISPDMFNIYMNKEKPLAVYWSKTFLSDNPGFLEKFNRLISKCTSGGAQTP